MDRSILLAGFYSQQANYYPFPGLEHQRNRVRYCVDHFGMIEPEKIKIPGSHEEEGGPHSFFKVPIGIVIQRLLQFDDVYEEWTCSSARVPGVYSSYKDGEAFQSSLFFSNHPDGLHIHLYLDDDQPCNENGSRNEKNKLLFIYFIGRWLRGEAELAPLVASVDLAHLRHSSRPVRSSSFCSPFDPFFSTLFSLLCFVRVQFEC